MHDDEDSLRAAYDLDAWAPPAAPDVTAAVIARMTEPAARAAAATTMVEHPAAARTRRKWALAGIGFTATAIGALATYLLMRDTGPGTDQGSVATATPSRLDLGASSAQLEANTDLVWRRDGHALRVEQPRGTSTWTLGPDETLEITAGAAAGGNDQVAIRATGASLRVEVGMNLSDAKIIGASAVAASAVAAITIVVYEGEARVTSAGQTVEMRAGGTLEARADRAPSPRELVGGAPIGEDPDLADRKKLQAAIDKLRAAAETCMNGTATSPTPVELVLDVTPEGGTEIARLDFRPAPPDAADLCVNEHVLAQRFATTRLGGRFRLSFQLTKRCDADALARAAEKARSDGRHSGAEVYRAAAAACPAAPSCDHDTLAAIGADKIGRGEYAAALESLEAALACKEEPSTVAKAYLAACNGRNEAKAVEMYRRLAADKQDLYKQICLRNGISMPESYTVAGIDPSKDPNIQAARVAIADGKWDEAIEAAERAKGHPEAKDLYDKAHQGSRAEAAMRNMEEALLKGDYMSAARELANTRVWPQIQAKAEKTFNAETAREVARLSQTAKSRALSDDTCAAFRAHMARVASTYPDNMVERVRLGAGTCPRGKPADVGTGSGSSNATTAKSPKHPECTPEKLKSNRAQVDSAIGRGAYGEATAVADRVLACGFDGAVLARGFLAACNGRDVATARRYFKIMSPDVREKYAQICTRNGVTLP